MASAKTRVVRNPATGSYTVHVPKDARTGTFVAKSLATGRIVVTEPTKKSN